MEKDDQIKKELLKDYISLYINKDIRRLAQIENIFEYNHLLTLLSSQTGSLLNINEVSNTINLPRQTIKNYISILQHTFILDLLPPYYNNLRKQISKMPKIYFKDLGLRNQLLMRDSLSVSAITSGELMENFVYNELLNFFDKEKVFFFRTNNKQEVDFVVE